MTNHEIIDEAEAINKLIISEKIEEAFNRFKKHSLEDRISILFMIYAAENLLLRNHPLFKF